METSGQALDKVAKVAKAHHYSVETIQISVQQVINCGTSLRGVEKTFELYVDFSEHGTPSFSSIRKWLGRIGLYFYPAMYTMSATTTTNRVIFFISPISTFTMSLF